jgi:hypothetical protein
MLLSSEIALIVGVSDVLEAGTVRVTRHWQASPRPAGVREHVQIDNGGPPGDLRDPVVSMSEKLARGKRYHKPQARRWAHDGVGRDEDSRVLPWYRRAKETK